MASIARLNQHVAALLASTGGFAAGITLGWNSFAGLELRGAIGWLEEDGDLVVSVVAAGAVLGALMLGLLPQKCRAGSSSAIVCSALPPLVLGWMLICFGDYSYWYLLWGRALCGLGLGTLCTLVPLYIGEIAALEAKQRDVLLFYFHMMLSGGIACSFAVASSILLEDEYETSFKRYSMGCAAACVPAILCCAAPQSPLQRAKSEEDREAVDVARRDRTMSVNDELMLSLAHAIDEEKLKMLKSAMFWRRFVAVIVVTAMQQLSGASPIIFNALTLFDFAGSGKLTSGQLNLVCAAVLILASMLSVLLVAHFKRRTLLVASSLLMGISLILLGWYIKLREDNSEIIVGYSWVPPVCIALYFGSYTLGVGPVSWALLADSFPMQLRVLSASVISATSWLLCLILNHELRALLTNLHIPETLWLYAGFCLLGVPLACCLVRESGTKSLADVQAEFRIS